MDSLAMPGQLCVLAWFGSLEPLGPTCHCTVAVRMDKYDMSSQEQASLSRIPKVASRFRF